MVGLNDLRLPYKFITIKDKLHILLIGPVTNAQAKLIGGATISFGYLIDFFQKNQVAHSVVTTQYFPKGKKRILNPLYVLGKVLKQVGKSDVLFLNCSDKGIKYLSPILYIIARLCRLRYIVRPFGGDFKEYTDKFGGIAKWFLRRTTLQADLLFLQTKSLKKAFINTNENVHQLPTSRDAPATHLLRTNRPFQKRFIFLGFVNSSKGIDHLLEATTQLDHSYTIHIYGPIKENYIPTKQQSLRAKLEKAPHIYKGVLEKEKVLATLGQYDVLVLPTFYRGEGYPGVILEAYSLGLPVITTYWKAIPEIVQHQETGLLIEPQSTTALLTAMRSFNTKNYSQFSTNAKQYFEQSFSTEKVAGNVLEKIKMLF